ncbi:CLUMA_CG005826, isoform A [Clunio marinus]|uniref:CLUMA_CG005826, isoform A n=1 Tax=Clunio marinus TaxID=568069 RepID=A0A1J1HVY1_9DIPT|nr:CLUMA_CG005826, isoform A [Clunio marinus]
MYCNIENILIRILGKKEEKFVGQDYGCRYASTLVLVLAYRQPYVFATMTNKFTRDFLILDYYSDNICGYKSLQLNRVLALNEKFIIWLLEVVKVPH